MSVFRKIWKFVAPVLLNKYLLVLVVFGVFVIFFDEHNLIDRWRTRQKIRQLEKELRYFQDEIKINKLRLEDLQANPEYLEKIAREQYKMKKDNEEIFIIEE